MQQICQGQDSHVCETDPKQGLKILSMDDPKTEAWGITSLLYAVFIWFVALLGKMILNSKREKAANLHRSKTDEFP